METIKTELEERDPLEVTFCDEANTVSDFEVSPSAQGLKTELDKSSLKVSCFIGHFEYVNIK
jgi:hypothetical protein